MNESPVPPLQPDPVSSPQPTMQPTPSAELAPLVPGGTRTLSIWSLVLGIVALTFAIVFFISIPAGIVAVVLGSIALAKHSAGKGMALTGIITGGLALLITPVILLGFSALNHAAQLEKDLNSTGQSMHMDESTLPAVIGTAVYARCFTYEMPTGYKFEDASKNCTTAVNIPGGDALTRITVKANTGTIGSLQDVVAAFNKTIQAGNSSAPGVIDQEQFTNANNDPVYYVSYKDSYGLLNGNYITPDTTASQKDENGKTITGYTVAGYTYNSQLKSMVRSVLDSLKIN